MLLAKFIVNGDIYEISGDFEVISGNTDEFSEEYIYPEYKNLIAKKGNSQYKPAGESWTGRKYRENDMMNGFISSLIMGNTAYQKLFLANGLEEVVEYYTNYRTEKENFSTPDRILDMQNNCYNFSFATDAFLYFTWYDSVLMLRTDAHTIVSDNYFAEVGMCESLEAIEKGEEELIIASNLFKMNDTV